MANWIPVNGAAAIAFQSPALFRERSRYWFVRGNRANGTAALEVRIYGDQADATAGNANYCASGSVAYAALQASLTNTVGLVDNAGVNPTWPTGSTVKASIDSLAVTGAIVWRVDLGPRAQRALRRIHRGLSGISEAGGYLTTPVLVELGLRPWDATEGARPYIGVAFEQVRSEPIEVGGSLATTLGVVILAWLDRPSPEEDEDLYLWQDIRRAIRTMNAGTEADLPAAIDGGAIWNTLEVSSAEVAKGQDWIRERGGLVFRADLQLFEDKAEVEGG